MAETKKKVKPGYKAAAKKDKNKKDSEETFVSTHCAVGQADDVENSYLNFVV